MFQIKKPIRIAQQEQDKFLVSLPSLGIKIEINQNVLQFIQFMIEKEEISKNIVEEYISKYGIENKDDYDEMLLNMMEVGLLVKI